jgi:hypothetical protein
MELALLIRPGHAGVALDAVDAAKDVRAVLERMRGRLAMQPQRPGARHQRQG